MNAWIAPGCCFVLVFALTACGGDSGDSDVVVPEMEEDVDATPAPPSVEPDDPEVRKPNVAGRISDWESNAVIADATVVSEPETERLRTTALGQYVFQDNVVGGTVYTVQAEAEGYAPGAAVVLAVDGESRSADIGLLPNRIASVLLLKPGALWFDPNTRRQNLILENPSREVLRWSFQEGQLPPWLIPSSDSGLAYTGSPEVLTLQVRNDLLPSTQENTQASILLEDEDGQLMLLRVVVQPQDQTLLSLEPGDNSPSVSPGALLRVNSQVMHDGKPVIGEQVVCSVYADGAVADVRVLAETDNLGVATCIFEAEIASENNVSVQVELAYHPDVAGFNWDVAVE